MSKPITTYAGLVCAGLLFAGTATAAPMHYLSTPRAVAVDSQGECWVDAYWTEANAIAECHPDLVNPMIEVSAVETVTKLGKQEVNLAAKTLFGFDEAELTTEGMKTLDRVAASASEVPNQTIRITGHTDRIGSLAHNMDLSKRRAKAVQDYLSAKGLRMDNMEIAGVGPAESVVACEGKGGSALIDCLAPNRRTVVEFSAIEVMDEKMTK